MNKAIKLISMSMFMFFIVQLADFINTQELTTTIEFRTIILMVLGIFVSKLLKVMWEEA